MEMALEHILGLEDLADADYLDSHASRKRSGVVVFDTHQKGNGNSESNFDYRPEVFYLRSEVSSLISPRYFG